MCLSNFIISNKPLLGAVWGIWPREALASEACLSDILQTQVRIRFYVRVCEFYIVLIWFELVCRIIVWEKFPKRKRSGTKCRSALEYAREKVAAVG